MRSYDDIILHGMSGSSGRLLWAQLKIKCPTHNDMLQEMRERQMDLARYARTHSMDEIQMTYLREIRLLETMAWRMYMFGERNMYSLKPGAAGEYNKRRRNDTHYWFVLRDRIALHGQKEGQKIADKWLKSQMRQEWEQGILRRYRY